MNKEMILKAFKSQNWLKMLEQNSQSQHGRSIVSRMSKFIDEKDIYSIRLIVDNSICWSDTPQGRSYWSNVNDRWYTYCSNHEEMF